MRRNGYLWTSGVNLDTTIRFADPDFPFECKISVIWRRLPLIIAFYILNVRHISTSGLFDLSTATLIIPTKFEVDMCIHCRVIAFLSADTSHDLDLWPLDLEQFLCTKFEAPTPILSWVMSDNVSNWLPLKMRTRPLRMRRITWPVSRGSKTITFLEFPTPICLFTLQLRWLYDEYNKSYLRK